MDKLVWKGVGELLPVFGKQLALIMDSYIEEESRERVIRENERTAHEICTRFLRTLEFDISNIQEMSAIKTTCNQFETVIDSTIFQVADLN